MIQSWYGIDMIKKILRKYPEFSFVREENGAVVVSYKGSAYILADNGGEITVKTAEGLFWGEFPTVYFNTALNAETLMYRLIQTIETQPIDYELVVPALPEYKVHYTANKKPYMVTATLCFYRWGPMGSYIVACKSQNRKHVTFSVNGNVGLPDAVRFQSTVSEAFELIARWEAQSFEEVVAWVSGENDGTH